MDRVDTDISSSHKNCNQLCNKYTHWEVNEWVLREYKAFNDCSSIAASDSYVVGNKQHAAAPLIWLRNETYEIERSQML